MSQVLSNSFNSVLSIYLIVELVATRVLIGGLLLCVFNGTPIFGVVSSANSSLENWQTPSAMYIIMLHVKRELLSTL